MSGFFRALKNQIKEEVERIAQPPPQQQNPTPQHQYQHNQQQPFQQPNQYGNSQAYYGQPPPPQTYQQYQHGSVPQPHYPPNPQPNPNSQVPLPREGQSYGAYPAPPPGPPPMSQPFGMNVPPAPPVATFQNSGAQAHTCTARKDVLTKYNQFYVFKHSEFPRLDPKEQDLTFAICEGCYKTHLSRQTGFVSSFEAFQSPDATASGAVAIPTSRAVCDFWFPVVIDAFYKQCIPQNSIQPLIRVAHEIQKLSQCPGNQIWQGGELYSSPSTPHCSVCVRCYELYLKPAFGNDFRKEQRGPTAQWTCDIGKEPGYVHDLLTSTLRSTQPSFPNFARELNERLNIAPCAGEATAIQPNQGSNVLMYCIPNVDLGACPECYYDYLKLSPFSQFFRPTSYNSKSGAVACDLASPMSRFLMTKALANNNLAIWQQGLDSFTKIPKCAYMTGVPEEDVENQQNQLGQLATWYSVIHCPNLEICPSCYHCVVTPLGTTHLFRPITRPLAAGVVRVCNFSIGSGGVISDDPNDFPTTLQWRGFMLRTVLDRLSEVSPAMPLQNRDFGIFLSLATLLNTAGPPCGAGVRGFKKPSGRRYFGHMATNSNDQNDCTVVMCEECYNDLVKDSTLNQWLGNDLTDEVYRGDQPPWAKEGFCQPWSKTSKNVLRQADEAGDFTIFARHWNHRTLIREQTLPQIVLLRQQYHLQNQVKMNSYLNATMVQGGASISEAAGTTGHNYGNSVVGMGFNSYAGVDAAMWKRKADQTQWGDTGNFMKIAELERLWKTVE